MTHSTLPRPHSPLRSFDRDQKGWTAKGIPEWQNHFSCENPVSNTGRRPQTGSSVLKSERAPNASIEAWVRPVASQLLSSLLGIDLGKQTDVRRHALPSTLRISSALEVVGCTDRLSNTLLKSPEILYTILKFTHSQSCSWLGLSGAEDVCPGGTLSYTSRRAGLVTVCPCTAG